MFTRIVTTATHAQVKFLSEKKKKNEFSNLCLSGNNPIIFMIKPDVIVVQEIKVQPVKAKIMDMVVIRHQTSGDDYRTTLILLCEDGSLRMYMASVEYCGKL